ncbi:hypothetical protein GGS21DRAFT_368813 [Xylaria nigripes]|nr:hypothetical protein GGS21DRAFT_368813 [Xylaria nigripes]
MVGVPKSKRCTFCKARKTKCDERWPTCGACARAGKTCSGPRSTYKFVSNGNHREPPDSVDHDTEAGCLSLSKTDNASMVRKQNGLDATVPNPKDASANISEFRCHLFTGLPKRPQWTQSDRLISRLVTSLNTDPGTGHDLRIVGAFLPLIPQRLGNGNTALDHAVELMLSGWTRCRRGLPSNTWLNLRMYNKALRSLKTALDVNDPEQLTGTLTALCILQKAEVLYDFARGSNQETHAAGLIAVVNRSGPEQPITVMALHVLFEGIFHMLQEDIRQGRESDLHTPQWINALRQAIDTNGSTLVHKHLYHLWVEMTAWPGLARLVSLIRQNPWNKIAATELHRRATILAQYLRQLDETVLAHLVRSEAITQVRNTTSFGLYPECYRFENFTTAKLFGGHACFSIITRRFLQEAGQVLGFVDQDLEKQARVFSKRIWMSSPWVQSQTPLGVDFTAGLVFSYESGNEEERKFCIASLEKMDSYRRPPPIGQWAEETVMANAKAYSGRLPFIKTQDPKVEYDGIGCRC